MAISNKIEYTSLDNFYLDPLNPRLGRANTGPKLKQSKILSLMRNWTLDELAISFLESGFWPQEALIVVSEEIYGSEKLVVIEGNRRLAALNYLNDAFDGRIDERKWLELVEDQDKKDVLFAEIPYILVDSREDVQAFLGFRHVTGIKQWKPAEKAEYIAHLIEQQDMDYRDVMRKIGSKTATVRQNYISYNLLIQMESQEDISVDHVEEKFSVLFLSLRTEGVKTYLSIDLQAEPELAKTPVPENKLQQLVNFATWLFGTEDKEPIVKDSRQVDNFGRILMSPKATEYLERQSRPSFDTAFQIAGGDEPEIVDLIETAADNVESALSRAHRYSKSVDLAAATLRLSEDTERLSDIFPEIHAQFFKDRK